MRRWVARYAGVAAAAVLAACGVACGSSGAPNSAADWIDAGVAHFRDAESVTVTPDAAGEATCSEVLPSCAPYTLTQTSTFTPSVAECPSIPVCAATLFSPRAHSYTFVAPGSPPAAGVIVISGDPGCKEGAWCSWTMSIDRATQEILAADIHVGDTDHAGWPIYRFSNYRVSGSAVDTPTPSPAPSPTPPESTGTLTAMFTGDLNFTTSRLPSRCDADGFEFFSVAPPVTATTPTLRMFEFSPWGQPTDDLIVQIFPEPPQHVNGADDVFSYHGNATATPLGSDRWHVHFVGVLTREDHPGALTVDATVSCG